MKHYYYIFIVIIIGVQLQVTTTSTQLYRIRMAIIILHVFHERDVRCRRRLADAAYSRKCEKITHFYIHIILYICTTHIASSSSPSTILEARTYIIYIYI